MMVKQVSNDDVFASRRQSREQSAIELLRHVDGQDRSGYLYSGPVRDEVRAFLREIDNPRPVPPPPVVVTKGIPIFPFMVMLSVGMAIGAVIGFHITHW